MLRKRISYLLLIAIFGLFLFFYQKTYLLFIIIGLLLLALLFYVLLWKDSSRLEIKVEIPQGSRVEKTVVLAMDAHKKGRIWVAGSIIAEIELYHTMYDISIPKNIVIPLSGDRFHYEIPVDLKYCGEIYVRCHSLKVCDLLGLFSRSLNKFRQPSVMVYPARVNLDVEISHASVGLPQSDGQFQNRKGKDPSEIFDLRDYVPGDDIRSIHWKLSGKLDHLVVKQPSDPTHFQVMLMPDLSCGQMEGEVTVRQLNTAVAVCFGVGEQLLDQGMHYHMAFPTGQGLTFFEIRSSKELQDAMYAWMSMKLPETEGTGLKYFTTEHMEQYFSRVMMISAGRYLQNLDELEGRINMTVISVVDGADMLHLKLNHTCDVVELPVVMDPQTVYRIWC